MLLEVSVQNFNSFAKKQTFKLYANEKGNIFGSTISARYKGLQDKIKTEKLYKSNVIYGLNNGGKTNFINAINIISGATEQSWEQGLPKDSHFFLLSKKLKNEPSIFEIIFIADKIKYEYTFSINNEIVLYEKLIAYPKGESKLYYERKYENDNYIWNIDNLKENKNSQIERIQEDTKRDCLLLSTANKFKNEFLKPVYEFLINIRICNLFGSLLNISELDFNDRKTIDLLYENNEKSSFFKKIFTLLITNGKEEIKNIYLKQEDMNTEKKLWLEKRMEKTPIDKQEQVKNNFFKYNQNRIKLLKYNEETETEFDLVQTESAGTNRFINLLSLLYDKKDTGGVFVFDELDSQLHPKLVVLLLKIIYKYDWKIQLIFTAHNTAFMKKRFDIFRKHQIWFTDKDIMQQTILYTAGETDIRKEKDLETLYYNGRFGSMLDDDLIAQLGD